MTRCADEFTLRAKIAIRRAAESDLASLEWYGLWTEHRELIHRAFARQQSGEVVMLVADLSGFPVGQVWVDLTEKREESAGVLWALRVFPFLRSRGIGARLIAAGEAHLACRGYRWAEIAVERAGPRAESLYLRLGYRLAGARRDQYSYRSPSGAVITVPIELRLLRKRLRATRSEPDAHR